MVKYRSGVKGGISHSKIVAKTKEQAEITLKHHDKTIREIIEGVLSGKPAFVKSQQTVNDLRRFDDYHQIEIHYDVLQQHYTVKKKRKTELTYAEVREKLEQGLKKQYRYAFDIPGVEECISEIAKQTDKAQQYLLGFIHFNEAFQEVSHLLEELLPENEIYEL